MMSEASRSPLGKDEKHFIDEVAALMQPWGFAPSVGRVYAYLLLRQCKLSIDDIAEALEMSRAGVWSAAKFLEHFEHVKRSGSVGSKRALYEASRNYTYPVLEQIKLLENMGRLMRDCAAGVARGEAAEALSDRADFYFALRTSMAEAIETVAAARVKD